MLFPFDEQNKQEHRISGRRFFNIDAMVALLITDQYTISVDLIIDGEIVALHKYICNGMEDMANANYNSR